MIKYYKKLKSVINKMVLSSDYHIVPRYYGRSSSKQPDIRNNEYFGNLATKVIEDQKTSLYYDRLYTIYNAIDNLRIRLNTTDEVNCIEAGVFKGGGSYFIASILQTFGFSNFKHYAVDTFEGHSELDFQTNQLEGAHSPGLFDETSYREVKKYLSVFPEVEVFQGRIQDAADKFENMKFGFVHLDMDIYQPTKFSLDFFSSRLILGGIFVIDDYEFQTCPGIKKAIDEFLLVNKNFVQIPLLSGQCQLVKVA